MAKTVRTMRLSDEIIGIIESQEGETFTEKFENLVSISIRELPEKKRQLAEYQRMIDQEKKQLSFIRDKKQKLQRNLTSLEYDTAMLMHKINKAMEDLE